MKPYSDGDPGIGWDFSQNSLGWVVLRVAMGLDCLCEGQCVCDSGIHCKGAAADCSGEDGKMVVMVMMAVVIITTLGMTTSWWQQWWRYDDGAGEVGSDEDGGDAGCGVVALVHGSKLSQYSNGTNLLATFYK